MSTTRNVVVYSVSFNGLFGRNRKSKCVTRQLAPLPEASVLDDLELAEVCEDFIEKIGAKKGTVRVTRYDNCQESKYDDLSGTSLTIPMTQGEKAWEYSV